MSRKVAEQGRLVVAADARQHVVGLGRGERPERTPASGRCTFLAASTGLRQGELLALRWADLDVEAGRIAVRASLQMIDGKPELVPTKTRHQAQLAAASLPRFRFHDLRHTAATLMLGQGVSPQVVMEALGHSTITTTMNIYAHVMEPQQREAADRMDEALAGG